MGNAAWACTEARLERMIGRVVASAREPENWLPAQPAMPAMVSAGHSSGQIRTLPGFTSNFPPGHGRSQAGRSFAAELLSRCERSTIAYLPPLFGRHPLWPCWKPQDWSCSASACDPHSIFGAPIWVAKRRRHVLSGANSNLRALSLPVLVSAKQSPSASRIFFDQAGLPSGRY